MKATGAWAAERGCLRSCLTLHAHRTPALFRLRLVPHLSLSPSVPFVHPLMRSLLSSPLLGYPSCELSRVPSSQFRPLSRSRGRFAAPRPFSSPVPSTAAAMANRQPQQGKICQFKLVLLGRWATGKGMGESGTSSPLFSFFSALFLSRVASRFFSCGASSIILPLRTFASRTASVLFLFLFVCVCVVYRAAPRELRSECDACRREVAMTWRISGPFPTGVDVSDRSMACACAAVVQTRLKGARWGERYRAVDDLTINR
jgi:hypothetical protein